MDNAAIAALDHAGQQEPCQMRVTRHHQLYEIAMRAPVAFRIISRQSKPSVVHQKIDVNVLTLQRTDDLFRRQRIGKIGGDGFDRDAMTAAKVRRNLVEPFFSPRHQNQIGGARRQLVGEGFANAGRGAGDQRPFSLIIHGADLGPFRRAGQSAGAAQGASIRFAMLFRSRLQRIIVKIEQQQTPWKSLSSLLSFSSSRRSSSGIFRMQRKAAMGRAASSPCALSRTRRSVMAPNAPTGLNRGSRDARRTKKRLLTRQTPQARKSTRNACGANSAAKMRRAIASKTGVRKILTLSNGCRRQVRRLPGCVSQTCSGLIG